MFLDVNPLNLLYLLISSEYLRHYGFIGDKLIVLTQIASERIYFHIIESNLIGLKLTVNKTNCSGLSRMGCNIVFTLYSTFRFLIQVAILTILPCHTQVSKLADFCKEGLL